MDQVSNPDSQDCSCSEAQRTVIGLRRLICTSILILHLGYVYVFRQMYYGKLCELSITTYIVVCIRNTRTPDTKIILLEL